MLDTGRLSKNLDVIRLGERLSALHPDWDPLLPLLLQVVLEILTRVPVCSRRKINQQTPAKLERRK
jgi:hypothetical protein